MSIYMTLLLRGHCAVDYVEASKRTKLEARLARAVKSMSWTNCTFLGSHWLRLSHHQFHSLRPRFWTEEIGWGFYCIHGCISAKLVWVGWVLSCVVGSTPMPINCKTKVGLIGPAARPKCSVPFPPGFCLPEVGTAVSMKNDSRSSE